MWGVIRDTSDPRVPGFTLIPAHIDMHRSSISWLMCVAGTNFPLMSLCSGANGVKRALMENKKKKTKHKKHYGWWTRCFFCSNGLCIQHPGVLKKAKKKTLLCSSHKYTILFCCHWVYWHWNALGIRKVITWPHLHVGDKHTTQG